VPGYETAVVRLVRFAPGRPTAGVGVLVGAGQVVTCAHVVNTCLGRKQRAQDQPGQSDLVQVEFPFLTGHPVREACVVAWRPPPVSGVGTGDVAGLELTEKAPATAVPARFIEAPSVGSRLRVYGYPQKPPRPEGVWVDLDLKGEVASGLLQVESRTDQTVKAQPGFSGSPVWDDSSGRAIGLLTATAYDDEPDRDAYLLPARTVAEAWEEQFDYLLVPANPYRGLKPFTADHAAVFFGRDSEITELTTRVRAQPVTIVVGPSGVGKSSLVQAGLVPALRQQQAWAVTLVDRPGLDPWHGLATELVRAKAGREVPVTQDGVEQQIAQLRAQGFGPVARFLRSQGRPLLVVIDQFEELLAREGGPDSDLLDLLLPTPENADTATRVVLTLRADFQPALQSIPGFHTRLNDRLYLLSPLTGAQLREAVKRPAATAGVRFEPGLIDQIVADAAGGALPLLEFTLTQLWDTQRHKTLTFTGYHRMGGVHGALNRFAEETAARLEPADEALDRVLLRLVRTPGAGVEMVTRQRVFQSDVAADEWDVLRSLAAARLVVLDSRSPDRPPYAQLAHESLITAWRRLCDLVRNNAEFLEWLARTRQYSADGYPLPEARIAEARGWLTSRPADVPQPVKDFIENSQTRVEEQVRELRDALHRAEALRLASEAELALRGRRGETTVALALAVESVLTDATLQGDLILRHVLRLCPKTLARLDHDDWVRAVAFSPDGTRVATGSDDGSARVFEAATGAELARLDHDDWVRAVAFSPDGTPVATGC
jgi:hypothetical protein